MCEACKVEKQLVLPKQHVVEPDWLLFIKNIAQKMVKEQSLTTLVKLRENLYELIVFGIPSEIIFCALLKELLKNCDLDLAALIVEQAALYEHRLAQGNKEIFHLEAFVAKCMCLYQNMMQELLACDF